MGYEDLKAILDESRDQRRQEASQPPVACPHDGELLDVGPRGVRNCPLGNFRWEGGSAR